MNSFYRGKKDYLIEVDYICSVLNLSSTLEELVGFFKFILVEDILGMAFVTDLDEKYPILRKVFYLFLK